MPWLAAPDGEHVVDAHAQIRHDDDPERLPDAAAFLAVALLLGAFGEQLDGDPDDHRAADQLDEGHVQQLRHQEGADHPDDDRAAGTQNDPHLAVFALKVLDRHGDDHGVVAGQHQIDEHDAHHRHEEIPT